MVISSSSFSIHQLHFFNSLRCQFWAPRTQVFLIPVWLGLLIPFYFCPCFMIFYTQQETPIVIKCAVESRYWKLGNWIQFRCCIILNLDTMTFCLLFIRLFSFEIKKAAAFSSFAFSCRILMIIYEKLLVEITTLFIFKRDKMLKFF